MFYFGINIAKRNHEAKVINTLGKALADSIFFSNSKEGCEKLERLFEKFKIITSDIVIGMEATGHYWLPVYEHLSELEYIVKVINPI